MKHGVTFQHLAGTEGFSGNGLHFSLQRCPIRYVIFLKDLHFAVFLILVHRVCLSILFHYRILLIFANRIHNWSSTIICGKRWHSKNSFKTLTLHRWFANILRPSARCGRATSPNSIISPVAGLSKLLRRI